MCRPTKSSFYRSTLTLLLILLLGSSSRFRSGGIGHLDVLLLLLCALLVGGLFALPRLLLFLRLSPPLDLRCFFCLGLAVYSRCLLFLLLSALSLLLISLSLLLVLLFLYSLLLLFFLISLLFTLRLNPLLLFATATLFYLLLLILTLSSSLLLLLLISLILLGGVITTLAGLERRDNLLDDADGALGRAGLGGQDLAGLVDDEDAPGRALGLLLEADGVDQGGGRVAQQRVGQLLLRLEGRVGLLRVGRQAVDGEPGGRGEGLVVVPEGAGLSGAF